MTRLNFENITCEYRVSGKANSLTLSGMYLDCSPSEESGKDPNLYYMIQVPETLNFRWSGPYTRGFAWVFVRTSYLIRPDVWSGDTEGFVSSELPQSESISFPYIRNEISFERRPAYLPRGKTAYDAQINYGVSMSDIPDYMFLEQESQIQLFSVPPKPSYSVSFDANGGTGAPNSQTKWYAENLVIDSATPTYSGYSFKRWNTNVNDTGTAYSPGSTYTANAGLSLHAIWNHTLAFDANGGSGAPSAQIGLKTSAITIPSSTPTRSGWRFAGWNTASDGSGTSYSPSASYPANQPDVTLYAQWERLVTNVKINSAVVKRVDSPTSTTESDEGEYARIEVPYTIEGPAAADVSLSVSVMPDHGDIPIVTFIESTSEKSEDENLSGTFTAVAATCYQDTRYSFSITVTAENTSASQADVSRTETIVLAMAFFTMDFLAGGHGVGIGKPATREMLDVGMQTQFDKPIKIAETDVPPTFYYTTKPSDPLDLPVRPCIVIQTSDWTVWYCDNETSPSYHQLGTPASIGAIAANSASQSGSDLNNMTNGENWWGSGFVNAPDNGWYRVVCFGETQIAFRFAGDTTSPRLFARSYVNNVWQPWAEYSNTGHTHSYLPLSGGIETGSITSTNVSPLFLKAPNINRDAGNPSSTQYENQLWFKDKDNENIGLIRNWRDKYGTIGLQFGVCNENSSNNGDSWLLLNMQKPKAGAAGTWSVGEPANFRSAIGAVNKAGDTMTGLLNINTNGTTLTIGAANSGWTHFSSSANRQFYFNRTISVDGDFLIYNTSYAMLRTLTDSDRINYMAHSSGNYLHISTWNYGNFGVSWWSSDIRLKENIEDSDVDALGLVNAIPHRSFDMKRDGAHHDIGYIAQELEKLDEKLVMKVYQTRDVNGTSYFTGDYSYQIDERKVIPYLSRAIQQLSDENDELKAKNAELESRLERIEKELGL